MSEPGSLRRAQGLLASFRGRAERTLLWRIWERMLENEFLDRSVALAAKAFVAFFPLVIIVAAFMPDEVRTSIFTALTARLGISGKALADAKEAFATADDVRRATGLLGLVFAFFFASSFTTALQRVYLRAWRRPGGGGVTNYVRGPAWLAVILAYFALLGAARRLLDGPTGTAVFLLVNLVGAVVVWWVTADVMLRGQVRRRALAATGVLTGIAMAVYAATAPLWMPTVVENQQNQFGFFGVALALVTWFTGAAFCIVVGAAAGAVLAEDTGILGRWARGGESSTLRPDATEPLPAPVRTPRLVDALGRAEGEGEALGEPIDPASPTR